MKRFVQDETGTPSALLSKMPEDDIADTNPVRVIDVIVNELVPGKPELEDIERTATGRPAGGR